MATVCAPTFVVNHVEQHKDAIFNNQSKCVLVYAYTTKASFAVVLYGILTSEASATRTSLCVYGNEEERDEWLNVISDVLRIRRMTRVIEVIEFTETLDPNINLPPSFIGMVHCETLQRMFPYHQDLQDLVPFSSNFDEIYDIVGSYCADPDDPRGFAMGETPINYREASKSDPYSLVWDNLIFSRSALLKSTSSFYLNGISVCLNRFLLDDDNDEDEDDSVVDYYYNVLNASTYEIPSYIEHDGNDSLDDLRSARNAVYDLITIAPEVVNFSVVLPPEMRSSDTRAVASISDVTTVAEIEIPPFRSVIAWESISKPCAEYPINSESRVSVMWVYHEHLAYASRRPSGQTSGNIRYKLGHAKRAMEETTQDRYTTTKTMMVYLYMWINHACSFYILCPFVSKTHDLYTLKNARPIHPKDHLIHALQEDDTLIVFDTMFATDPELDLKSTRCKLIFATFCGTFEEAVLAEFMRLEKGLLPALLPTPFRISDVPMYPIHIDPRRILLQFELTSIIFYDQRDNVHCTLYECMCATYDYMLTMTNHIYFGNNTEYATIAGKMTDYYHFVHTAECADVSMVSWKTMNKASTIEALVEKKLVIDDIGSRNEKRDATRRMWTAAHNFFNTIQCDRPQTVTVKQVTKEFNALGRRLATEDLDRLIRLDEFLANTSDDITIRLVFNENALTLRQYIDSRTRPPVPTTDSRYQELLCRYCGQVLDSVYYYKKHMKTVHNGRRDKSKVHHCEACNSTLHGDWEYARHVRGPDHINRTQKTAERHECQVCNAVYSKRSLLDKHTATKHTSTTQTFCLACCEFLDEEDMMVHRMSMEHRRRVSGEEQSYCEYCKTRCQTKTDMQRHLDSEEHHRCVHMKGAIVPVVLHMNKWYLLLAAVERLIDGKGYYVDVQERQSLLALHEARELIADEQSFQTYATLLFISMTMHPSTRRFYIAHDQRSGMLVATVKGRTGIVGHFGEADKTNMIAEMMSNMDVEQQKYGTIAYAPSGLHKQIVAYAKFLGMRVTRSRATTKFLGRLGVYNSYWMSKKKVSQAEPSDTS